MNIPGNDLLEDALSVISSQEVIYYRAVSRALNNVGQYVTAYATGISIYGSFQPVDRKLYDQYGLNLQKVYYTFYTSNDLIDVKRDVSNDQLIFNGNRFKCESNNDWYVIDGWKGVLCCLNKTPSEMVFDGETIGG